MLSKFCFNLSYFLKNASKVIHRCDRAGIWGPSTPPAWTFHTGQSTHGGRVLSRSRWEPGTLHSPSLPSINASMCTGVQTVLLSLLTLKWLWLPFFLPLESKIIRKNFLSFPSEKILSFASQVLSTQERGQNHFNFYQFPVGVWKEWVFPFGKDRQVDDQQMVNTR